MSKAIILSILFLSTLALSCSKNCGPDEKETGIYGKWLLIQYYIDPGDGSGTWGPPPNNQTFVDFNTDGSFTGDVFFMAGYTRFELRPDSKIVFYRPDNSSITMRYQLSADTLIINPPCFEGCGLKFIGD